MKILIIKTGECETFDPERKLKIVSLGDVLRSTVLLSLYPDAHWYGSSESARLLSGVHLVSEIKANDYDVVVNLENNESIFKNLGSNTLGFIAPHLLRLAGGEVIELTQFLKNNSELNWSEKLFLLVGKKWQGEGTRLVSSVTKPRTYIGLNWKVGPKWPVKDWGKDKWLEVAELLARDYELSWQRGFDDLEVYIEWIKGCRVLLTHDSLGLHIAQALHIPVVALFGPTKAQDIPRLPHDVFINFLNPPYLTSQQAHEILEQVILRSENESSVRRE